MFINPQFDPQFGVTQIGNMFMPSDWLLGYDEGPFDGIDPGQSAHAPEASILNKWMGLESELFPDDSYTWKIFVQQCLYAWFGPRTILNVPAGNYTASVLVWPKLHMLGDGHEHPVDPWAGEVGLRLGGEDIQWVSGLQYSQYNLLEWEFQHAGGLLPIHFYLKGKYAIDNSFFIHYVKLEKSNSLPPTGMLSLDDVITLLRDNWVSNDEPEPPADDIVAGMMTYSQRDVDWKDDVMVTRTLGLAGCATTASAILASSIDAAITPGTLNVALKAVNGYTPVGHPNGPDLLYWSKVAEVVPGMEFVGYSKWEHSFADVNAVKSALAEGPVILGMDFDHAGVYTSHFAVGYELTDDGKDIRIIDPWYGDVSTLLERYGPGWDLRRAIYALAVFSFDSNVATTNKVGLHVQTWTSGVENFIATVMPTVVKVFHIDDIVKVWKYQPDAAVVYRHWVSDDSSYLYGDITTKVNQFISKFVGDISALSGIPQVQRGLLAVESINEVMAGPDIARAVLFDREFIRVLQQRLPLVRPVVATIPVGNPQHSDLEALLPLARDIVSANGYMGYHGYWTAADGVSFLERDWEKYAGRFEVMQDYFVGNGVSPNWIFGETGAIAIEPGGHMPPSEGWITCLGDLNKYVVDCISYNEKLNGSRYANSVVGGCLFTVNTDGSWDNFRHDDIVLGKLADAFSSI